MAQSNPEPEIVASFDPIEWAYSERDAASEPDAHTKPDADPNDMTISVCSESEREPVTTPEDTFLWVPLVALEFGLGV